MDDLIMLNSIEFNKVNINKELAQSKGLINGNDYNIYFLIQSLYKKAFDYYLINNSTIINYNNLIKDSNLDFGIMPIERRNSYHIFSYLNLDYIYIRNFLFIEKIPINYLKEIYKRIVEKNYNIDDTILNIVKNTFKDVIVDNYRNGEYVNDFKCCYGSVIPSNFVDCKKLAIVIHYGKNKKQYLKEEFYVNQKNKKCFLKSIISKVEENISKEIGVEVNVLIRTYVGE